MHKARTFVVCAGLIALALLLPPPVAAAWPTDPTVNVPVCSAGGEQQGPMVVSDGAGGAIVTWTDRRSGSDWDIYAQRISGDGVIQWTANGVALCTAIGDQYLPTLVSDGAGGAIVCWQDYRSDNSGDIFAQRISADGTVQWTADGVALCAATRDQQLPSIASDSAGGAIVTWQDGRSGPTVDIYAQRISATGASLWTANGVAICTAAGSQAYPTIVSDGAGGAIVTWFDRRNGTNYDIYSQRILAAGTVQWTANGVALCTAIGDQYSPTIISDGASGAIVTWVDYRSGPADIYVQRISASGTIQLAANGVALCTATGDQLYPKVVSDGSGGAIVTWVDFRVGDSDIFAQRISAAGTFQWPANGVALCTAIGPQQSPIIASDGAGGAIVTWQDARSGGDWDIYARRILAAGTVLGAADGVAVCTATGGQNPPTITSDGAGEAIVTWHDSRSGNADIYAQQIGPEPAIRSVLDLPDDQGGKVRIKWAASWLESPALGISMYGIWRRVEESTALKSIAAAAELAAPADGSVEAQPGTFRTTMSGTNTFYWEGVGTVVTHGYPTYTFTTFTFQDSTATSNPYSVFMVDYQATYWPGYWNSAPDSGYSVDNLAPPPPTPFAGQYASGAASLHWGLSTASDFSTFVLYRGSSAGFVPGPGSLVAARRDTGYVDSPGAPFYYKLCAVDVHGNASDFSTLLPSGTADVPAGASLEFALAGVLPNPSRGEGLTVAFTLPIAASARLELLDVSGRRMAEREVGLMGAGRHTLDLSQGAHLAPGLYLVRLTQGANTRTTRVAVLQ